MQIIEPIAIAACIPEAPASPVNLSIRVAIRRVAIAIPETGLLEEPTIPTILEDTVAKKKPNITTITAPINEIGIAGTSQTSNVKTAITIRTIFILMSCSVRSPLAEPAFFILFKAPRNVLIISGKDFIRLIIPPAANAPAPI
jgi:hypothetical protein